MSTEPIPSYQEMYWFLFRLWLTHHRDDQRDRRLPGCSLAAWHAAVWEIGQLRDEYKHHPSLDVACTARYCAVRITRAIHNELKHLPLSKHLRELEMPAWVAEMDD